jgi:hypothetical protein
MAKLGARTCSNKESHTAARAPDCHHGLILVIRPKPAEETAAMMENMSLSSRKAAKDSLWFTRIDTASHGSTELE